MSRFSMSLILSLMGVLLFGACSKKETVSTTQEQTTAAPSETGAATASSPPAVLPTVAEGSGFDINRVPVVTPQLGKFPFFTLIEGYEKSKYGNKEVDFDRYEFFDGTKIIPVEGRLATIEAAGKGASAFQVFKTYESLVTGLGGVKVFEGKGEDMDRAKVEFSDMRHRHPVYSGDQMGVYMLRTPDREVWVEGYVKEYGNKGGHYHLTVVEKKGLDVKASLLPAEEMKRELDAKGHVALYINFDFDKADIKADSQPVIDEIAKLLKSDPPLQLIVEGHTDNLGGPAYNKILSQTRAKAVVTAVTAQGVDVRRLREVGFGQDKPIADNSTDPGRAKNRRVELVKVQ